MRLEPVYLLAPEPKRPEKGGEFSRRFVLLAGIGGLAVGIGTSPLFSWLRSAKEGQDAQSRLAEDSPAKTVLDQELQWAADLLQRADSELAAMAIPFLQVAATRFEDAPMLAHGVLRVARAAAEPALPDMSEHRRRALAKAVLSTIREEPRVTSPELDALVPTLASLASHPR